MIEYQIGQHPPVQIYENEHLELRARYVLSLIEKWGMAGNELVSDEEGPSTNLIETVTIVKRAFAAIDLAFTEFEERGWVKHGPTLEQVQARFEGQK